jgi:hypothetical protein
MADSAASMQNKPAFHHFTISKYTVNESKVLAYSS